MADREVESEEQDLLKKKELVPPQVRYGNTLVLKLVIQRRNSRFVHCVTRS